jgi:hypothetical protein
MKLGDSLGHQSGGNRHFLKPQSAQNPTARLLPAIEPGLNSGPIFYDPNETARESGASHSIRPASQIAMGMKDADHDHHFFLDDVKQSVRKSANRCPASAAADSWLDFRVASHLLKRLLDAKQEVRAQSFTLTLIPRISFVEVGRGLGANPV